MPSKLTGNLILNDNFANTHSLSGGCYIGNGRMLTYFNTDTEIGALRCYDMTNYSVLWEYNIAANWGGSVTYNPTNNHAYLTAIRNLNGDIINKIIEIDLSNPGTILRTFSLPEVTGCATLAYDRDNDVFYSIPYLGTTAGVSDMLYCFDSSFGSVIRRVQLENFPCVKYKTSQQGLTIIDGVAYVITSSVHACAVWGYDVVSGELKQVSNIPFIINRCRSIGEVEHITYDYDNDRVLVGSVLIFSGVHNYYTYNLFEVDLLRDIFVSIPVPNNSYFELETAGRMRQFYCVMAGDSLKPSWLISNDLLTIPNDAFVYSSSNNAPVWIAFRHSYNNVNEQGESLEYLAIGGANVEIFGYENADRLKITNFTAEEPCAIIFRHCEFDGFEAVTLADGYYCNIFARHGARIYCWQCTFSSYTGAGYHCYHLISYIFARISINDCIFDGNVKSLGLTRFGGEIKKTGLFKEII